MAFSGDRIKFEYDEAKLKEVERVLSGIKNGLKKVMPKAINDTATSIRSRIAKKIGLKTKIKPSAIKRAIRIYRATQRRWFARVAVTGKPIPATYLQPEYDDKGGSYMHADERRTVLHAFKMKLPKKDLMVIRKEVGGKLVPRRPTRLVLGPSIVEMLLDQTGTLAKEETQFVQDELQKNIDRHVALLIKKSRERSAA